MIMMGRDRDQERDKSDSPAKAKTAVKGSVQERPTFAFNHERCGSPFEDTGKAKGDDGRTRASGLCDDSHIPASVCCSPVSAASAVATPPAGTTKGDDGRTRASGLCDDRPASVCRSPASAASAVAAAPPGTTTGDDGRPRASGLCDAFRDPASDCRSHASAAAAAASVAAGTTKGDDGRDRISAVCGEPRVPNGDGNAPSPSAGGVGAAERADGRSRRSAVGRRAATSGGWGARGNGEPTGLRRAHAGQCARARERARIGV